MPEEVLTSGIGKRINDSEKIDPKRAPRRRMSPGLFSSGIGIDPDYRGRGS
jgi:hypothetical protein